MSYALGRYGLGANGASTPAGPIGAIALLRTDLERTAVDATRFMQPGFQFRRSEFERLMAAFRRREGEDQAETNARVSRSIRELSGGEVQNLIAGTVGVIGTALIRAQAISELPVDGAEARAANQQLQATLTGPARLMWDSLSEMVRTMRPRATATSGLGELATAVVVALVIAGAIVLVAAVAAGTYLADAYFRLQHATAEAQRICADSGGCSPEQYARIRGELRVGPFDAALVEFARAAGEGIGDTIMIVGVGAAVLGLGALFWFGGGKDWVVKRLAQRQGRTTQMGYA